MRLRIDELAAKTGVTSRNIRAYREKGLLPPPELEGRTGFYSDEHVQRLEIIEDLQDRGFSLEAIRQTLEAWSVGGDLSHLLTLKQIMASPFEQEEPAEMTVEELFARFPDAMRDATLLVKAIRLGLVQRGDGRTLRIPSQLLLEAGDELTTIGVPLAEILDLVEGVQADMADVAERFVGIAERHLVRPVELGEPGARSPDAAVAAIERLRPLAAEVIRPLLAQQMQIAVTNALHRLVEALEID